MFNFPNLVWVSRNWYNPSSVLDNGYDHNIRRDWRRRLLSYQNHINSHIAELTAGYSFYFRFQDYLGRRLSICVWSTQQFAQCTVDNQNIKASQEAYKKKFYRLETDLHLMVNIYIWKLVYSDCGCSISSTKNTPLVSFVVNIFYLRRSQI